MAEDYGRNAVLKIILPRYRVKIIQFLRTVVQKALFQTAFHLLDGRKMLFQGKISDLNQVSVIKKTREMQ